MMIAVSIVIFINEKDPYCKLLICCSVSGTLGNVILFSLFISCCLSNSITVSIQLLNVIILIYDIICEGFSAMLEFQNFPSDELFRLKSWDVTGNNCFVLCFNKDSCKIWLLHHAVYYKTHTFLFL